jgi:DNA-binding NarL/FixJ family response regulator
MSIKLFIADDSAIMRNHIKELIAEIDQVELIGEAADASEAIRKLIHLEPDVVILDIRMPGGNGMAVLKELQKRTKPPISIIYTAFAYPQYREKYQRAGANYLFDKTQDTELFIEMITSLSAKKEINN